MGRKRKYENGTEQIGFFCRVEYAEMIRLQAQELGLSVNEYLNNMVVCSDKEAVAMISKEMIALRSSIQEKSKMLESANSELDSFKKNNQTSVDFLLEKIHDVPELAEGIKQVAGENKRMYQNLKQNSTLAEANKIVVDKVYAELEALMLEKHSFRLKKPALVKALIKKELLSR